MTHNLCADRSRAVPDNRSGAGDSPRADGGMNASMHLAGSIGVSLTFVTGVLVRFGQGLGNLLARRVTGWSWLAQAAPWVGMIAGATIGSAAYVRIGEPAIWAPIASAGVLAAGSTLIPQRD